MASNHFFVVIRSIRRRIVPYHLCTLSFRWDTRKLNKTLVNANRVVLYGHPRVERGVHHDLGNSGSSKSSPASCLGIATLAKNIDRSLTRNT